MHDRPHQLQTAHFQNFNHYQWHLEQFERRKPQFKGCHRRSSHLPQAFDSNTYSTLTLRPGSVSVLPSSITPSRSLQHRFHGGPVTLNPGSCIWATTTRDLGCKNGRQARRAQLAKRMATRPGDTMTKPSPPTINLLHNTCSLRSWPLPFSNCLLAGLEAHTICRKTVFVNRPELQNR